MRQQQNRTISPRKPGINSHRLFENNAQQNPRGNICKQSRGKCFQHIPWIISQRCFENSSRANPGEIFSITRWEIIPGICWTHLPERAREMGNYFFNKSNPRGNGHLLVVFPTRNHLFPRPRF